MRNRGHSIHYGGMVYQVLLLFEITARLLFDTIVSVNVDLLLLVMSKPDKGKPVRKRFFLGAVVLVLVVGYLLYLSFEDSVSYYLTVSELLDKGVEVYDTHVRVAGQVVDGSIDWNAKELELRFVIVENNVTLPVMYDGAKPEGFKADANILVDGRYQPDNIFHASQILMKCPSKYEPKE